MTVIDITTDIPSPATATPPSREAAVIRVKLPPIALAEIAAGAAAIAFTPATALTTVGTRETGGTGMINFA